VQGALDALPAGNTSAATITINAGTYHEIVHFASKNNVTLIGQDRKATIIEGTNNNNMNPSTATRSLVGIDNTSGLIIDTLTIQNLTPQGGSQAEALRLQSCDKCVVRNADIISRRQRRLRLGNGDRLFQQLRNQGGRACGRQCPSPKWRVDLRLRLRRLEAHGRLRHHRPGARSDRRQRVSGEPRRIRQLHDGQPHLPRRLDGHRRR
jgi:hypothetical protein